ncbi:MAG TPA: UPF0182 family protein [Cellulomonas sp.]
MTSAETPRPRPVARRRRGPLVPTIVTIVGLVVGLLVLSQLWTQVLWFDQLGFAQVLWTQWGTRVVLFVLGFVVMAGAVAVSLQYAYRSRPVYAPSSGEQANLDQYREAIEPLRRLVMIVGPLVLGLFGGGAAAQRWQTVQLFLHRQHVGQVDAQFGVDLGFYMFTLPLLRFVVSFLMTVTVLSVVGAVATHYLYGGLRIGSAAKGHRTTVQARRHLSVLGAVLLVLVAASYWLDRYSTLTKSTAANDRVQFAGAAFTDVHAVIPSKAILAVAALVVAAAFVANVFVANWRLPAIGVGLMIISAVVVGGIYPAIVQRFQVQPNQQDKEATYIQRNIDATRQAYGLTGVEVSEYPAVVTASAGQLRQDADTTASIRLMDPQIVAPSFRQLQQIRGFYNFPDTLSVDRYTVNGESRDTVIAVRELDLDGLSDSQKNWVNEHLVYTHGYGVVAAYGNTRGAQGAPAFWESGIPSTGGMGDYEPRIYFGQQSPSYSIVGGAEGSPGREFDYPDDSATSGAQTTRFPTQQVSAGPSIGNLWNKLMYSLKFGDEQMLFSSSVGANSQILYDRDPRDRVAKVAPYLELDGRVYPAVIDGRVKWVIDGYTTSDQYPYSASESLEDATTDSLTATSTTIQPLESKNVNYIRNSVKATVDAYDGHVDLYAWDPTDPVLKAWQAVFPASIKPESDISGDLMSHIRYPEDLFKVQRALLGKYHVTDAQQFFSGNDFWDNPADPTQSNGTIKQPPYYLTLQMPDQSKAAFSLMSTYIPAGSNARNVLTGYLAVDAEAGDAAGQPAADYGKLRLLTLPRDSTVPGPGQATNYFQSDTTASNELNILDQHGSTVRRGNLLTLPVGGGLLYVQPVYVQASTGATYPLLQRVLVAFGDKVGFAPTLDEALDQVFGGNSGATAGDAGTGTDTGTDTGTGDTGGSDAGGGGPTPSESPTAAPSGAPSATPTTGSAQADLADALQRASQAIKDSQAALQSGDFTAYGSAQKRLDTAVQDAMSAENRLGQSG